LSEAGANVAGVCVSQVAQDQLQANGGFEFHGFGVDYRNYGKHYRYSENQSSNRFQPASAAQGDNDSQTHGETKTTLVSASG